MNGRTSCAADEDRADRLALAQQAARLERAYANLSAGAFATIRVLVRIGLHVGNVDRSPLDDSAAASEFRARSQRAIARQALRP